MQRTRPTPSLALAVVMALSGSVLDQREATAGDARVATPRPVRDGVARFDLTAPKTLAIISSLAPTEGPFPIQLSIGTAGGSLPIRPGSGDTRPRLPLPPLVAAKPLAEGLPPSNRSFAILVRDGDPSSSGNYTTIDARLLAVGKHAQIYVDPTDLGRVDRGLVADLVATFDNRVFPLAAQRFGPAADVDGDGRFTILISSWLDRMAGGRAKVDGFVRGADLDASLEAPFGNRCDMMYINPSLQPGPHARTVLAHEYTHAVVFSRKALDRRDASSAIQEEEGWLDEALAHLVEDLHGFSKSNIDYRVSAFLSAPERYRLVVEDYYAANLFRSHGNRGGTYLFLRWLADREGEEVIDRLIRSPLRGTANIEAATGRLFAELYRDWSVALFLSGINGEATAGNEPGLYRSIDPRGTIEDWVLAGPRASRLSGVNARQNWTMVGTASHYVILERPPSGAAGVEIVGPREAELQVTTVPLPEDLGTVDLSIQPVRSANGERIFRATLQDRGGSNIRVGALCWEPLAPTHETQSMRSGLDMLGIASAFGSSALPSSGRRTSRAIAMGKANDATGPLIFKVVGTDAKGRRIAAWAEVGGNQEERNLLSP